MDFEIDNYNALREALYQISDAFLRENLPEDAVFGSRLVANELLSNVLQHGGGKAILRVAREGDEIRICVKSANGYRPPEKSVLAEAYAESGRGLYLVDAYSVRRDFTEGEGIRVFLKIR